MMSFWVVPCSALRAEPSLSATPIFIRLFLQCNITGAGRRCCGRTIGQGPAPVGRPQGPRQLLDISVPASALYQPEDEQQDDRADHRGDDGVDPEIADRRQLEE